MKVDQQVSYIDGDGARHQAVITKITGVGPSNYKTLNLRYNVAGNPVEVESVPYEADSPEGLGSWLLLGQRRTKSPAKDPAAEVQSPEQSEPGKPRKKSTSR